MLEAFFPADLIHGVFVDKEAVGFVNKAGKGFHAPNCRLCRLFGGVYAQQPLDILAVDVQVSFIVYVLLLCST